MVKLLLLLLIGGAIYQASRAWGPRAALLALLALVVAASLPSLLKLAAPALAVFIGYRAEVSLRDRPKLKG